jgi:tricorn protease
MAHPGYYRFPAIQGDTVAFTSEDDLWTVPASGGIPRRLTSSLSHAYRPFLSPDGSLLAFMGLEEGHPELYVMPADGGEARRLTYYGGTTRPAGWTLDGSRILFVSNHAQPFLSTMGLFSISPDGGPIEQIPVGPVNSLSLGSGGGMVIGRNTADPARWKRYRGGTAGNLWIDADGSRNFRPLIDLKGNVDSPMWIGDRIYFLSDHEGYGNIYSCAISGEDLRRHTDHDRFFARNPSSDGRRIVYHAGGDLYLLDPATDTSTLIDIQYHSPRGQRVRKYIETEEYLQDYALHPEGHSVLLTVRGKPVVMGAFCGPAVQYGIGDGVRYRLARYLNDGRRIVATSDSGGEETIVVLGGDGTEEEDRLDGLDIGRPIQLAVSPVADRIALSNHRNETIVVDLETREMKMLDKSPTLHDGTISWSPDGRWLAFNRAENPETSFLVVADVESGEVHKVTEPLLHDVSPAFDPDGKYLYFLSYRIFNPVYDNLHFDLGFPRGMRPYLITLREDLENPFIGKPKAPKDLHKSPEEEKKENEEEAKKEAPNVDIDFEGIERRIVAVPSQEGKFTQIGGTHGRIFFVHHPVEGSLGEGEPHPDGTLEMYDLETQKGETIATGVDEFELSGDGQTIAYRTGKSLRVLGTHAKDPKDDDGWVDLGRARISIDPRSEWKQMFSEAWRLQRDFFWTEGMLGIDWQEVRNRYEPLTDRIGSRSEVSDLIWEMHGELGTSHAYESGGDYRNSPRYAQGFLGADYRYDEEREGWTIEHVVQGDPWSDQSGSPLETPGVNARIGDTLVAINGRKLTRERTPYELLIHTAGTEISLTILHAGEEEPRTVTIKALAKETPARYREWVESNRRAVHEATGGRIGYVHVPNMGPLGYSEFHRGFLSESGRDGLVVDVRFNGGGHVSQLILEKLGRKRIAYNLSRHSMPSPYPDHSLAGPIVALTNEYAGSDGDIFSHNFKQMKLGPLIGKRTWGGVVGIWPRNPLVDGSVTTQPEFSYWFEDVHWGVENYGTDPDIVVEITPQDYAAGRDPQLERAITEAMSLLEAREIKRPEFGNRPTMAPAPLPARLVQTMPPMS